MEAWTGGKTIARMLQMEGVETVFGIVDGTYLHLFANMVELGMRFVTPRHETTAAHMAGAYARLTGKLGVCIASNGPGVANMLPGVAVENGEGNRVLLLTSSRRAGIAYPDRGGTYQCFDHVGVIRAMSKWSATAATHDRVPELLRKALRACWSGRPGVVHLDVPESVVNTPGPAPTLLAPHQYRRTAPLAPAAHEVEAAADLLLAADLPLVHAGSGVLHADASAELQRVAELLHAPVTTSWSARGVFAEGHALSWPMVHFDAVKQVRNAADVALVVGGLLGETDFWGKAPYWAPTTRQKLVQVDVDEASLGRNRPTDLAILADAKVFLAALGDVLESRRDEVPVETRRTRVAQLAGGVEKDRAELAKALKDTAAPMNTAHVGAACREFFADDDVVVFDGGNTAVWANAYHPVRTPNTQLGTWHFGHLGAGLGQALGAAVARPDRRVYCIIGDGAMGFQPQEIETAVRNGLRVVFLVVSDQQWGMVKMTELFALGALAAQFPNALSKGPAINADLGPIAWDDLARSMGAHGERVSSPAELRPALERAAAADTCAVIHVEVDPAKHLFAPGLMYFKEMHQEPAGE